MPDTHAQALAAKHASLDQRIAAETQRPMPDGFVIAALKKQKLKLKEALAGV